MSSRFLLFSVLYLIHGWSFFPLLFLFYLFFLLLQYSLCMLHLKLASYMYMSSRFLLFSVHLFTFLSLNVLHSFFFFNSCIFCLNSFKLSNYMSSRCPVDLHWFIFFQYPPIVLYQVWSLIFPFTISFIHCPVCFCSKPCSLFLSQSIIDSYIGYIFFTCPNKEL